MRLVGVGFGWALNKISNVSGVGWWGESIEGKDNTMRIVERKKKMELKMWSRVEG